jgi:hypothetical protein
MRYIRNRIGSCEACWGVYKVAPIRCSGFVSRVACITMTHAARVPTFNNLGDDSSPDVHKTPSPERMMEKPASPPAVVSGEFLLISFILFTTCLDDCFCRSYPACALTGFATGEPRRRSGVLSSSRKFCLTLILFCMLVVIHDFIALSEKRREKRSVELAQMAKLAELEVVTKPQVDKIVELEATCVNLKRGKEKLIDKYRRLVEKHELLTLANIVHLVRERLSWMDEDCEIRFKDRINIGSSNDTRIKMISSVYDENEWTTYIGVVKSEIHMIDVEHHPH